jgi:hypothetical protein
MNEQYIDKNDRDRMDIEVIPYRIHYLLRRYIKSIHHDTVDAKNEKISLDLFVYDRMLSSDGKKNQLIDQIISEAIAHFTTGVWEDKAQMIAGDLLGALSGDKGRRKAYGPLI